MFPAEDELRQRLHDHGLSRVAQTLLSRALYAIAFTCTRVDEDTLAIGASKLGGLPDLPPAMLWPAQNGRSMGLIAQFNLSDVAPYDRDHALPARGLLSFFYIDPYDDPDTGGVTDSGSAVLYVDADPATLVRRSAPPDLLAGRSVGDSGMSVFYPCALDFFNYGTLPDPMSLFARTLLTEEEWSTYIEVATGTPYETAPGHWLLVQNQGRLFEVTRAVAHSTDRSRPVVCHATAVAGSLGFKQTPRKQH